MADSARPQPSASMRHLGIEAPVVSPIALAAGGIERVTTAAQLRRHIAAWRASGLRIGFVPTMGALHAGHLSLVKRARESCDRVVASVFVNPTQFGPGEDLDSYPRDTEGDLRKLEQAGCHLVFLPAVEVLYPPGSSTFVEVTGPSRGFEGTERPGHFRGVATVVAGLLNLVQPDVAVFGEKDAQQLAVIRQLVRDLHRPVEILAAPSVREDDGLAMSSRNVYLSPEERRAARVLSRSLASARQAIEDGERDAATVRQIVEQVLDAEPLGSTDYVGIVDADSFQPVERLAGRVAIPIAYRLGATRLLDNLILDLN